MMKKSTPLKTRSKKLRFLVDGSTGIKVSLFLTSQGFDSISATEKFLGFEDLDLLKIAEAEKRIIVTNDKDFGDLIFYQKLNSFGVILLRLKNESSINKIRLIDALLINYPDKIMGNFIVITEDTVRIRPI